jgi:hypothetical protein
MMPINEMRRIVSLGLLASAGLAVARPAFAAGLAQPAGRVILTISGKIATTNVGETAQFDRDMLEAQGLVSFETTTPWYSGPQKFEGVSLDKLLKLVGANGDRIQAVALNDYTTEIPIEDFARYNVILALKRNNEYMPVRDKGPLFIVYPYDADPTLRSQKFYSRSAWQLAQIIVR